MKFLVNAKLRNKIVLLAIIPLLITGIVALILANTVIKDKFLNDTKSNLKATAESVLAAYEQNTGDYFLNSAGDLWKGAYNVSKSQTFIDNLAANTGIAITFFYGDERLVTSLKDSKGQYITGSRAGDFLKTTILQDGNELFTNRVQVEEEMYFGYYIPVYQNNSEEIIGMIFAGMPVDTVNASMNLIIIIFSLAIAVLVVITIIVCVLVANSISSSINSSITVVEELANGHLGIAVNEKYLQRTDEVGQLSNSTKALKDSLTEIIGSISENVTILEMAAQELQASSDKTSECMTNVEVAIGEIANGASNQANETIGASDNISSMGDIVADTEIAVNKLESEANIMKETSNNAIGILAQLQNVNSKTIEAVEEFNIQINATNKSVMDIRQSADMITEIADQTNLLSLNASIEAARAGEQGRGFAVVASEISKLAEQSSHAAESISNIISELLANSEKTMATMDDVSHVIKNQDEYVRNTEKSFNQVKAAVDSSLDNINNISSKTDQLIAIRNQIQSAIQNLSDVAQQNAAASEENTASVVEVTNIMVSVTDEVNKLNEIVNIFTENVNRFTF